jgi:integrase
LGFLLRGAKEAGGRCFGIGEPISGGEMVELGKTERSRGQVPLSRRALAALDTVPPRLDTPRIPPATRGGAASRATSSNGCRCGSSATTSTTTGRPSRPTSRARTSLVFPGARSGVLDIDNWRRRVWAPAVEAAGGRRPARIYDLRSTFASDALAAGVSAFELARVMGTSIEMVERHYGTLLDGATAGIAGIAGRLDALDDERDRATDERLGH